MMYVFCSVMHNMLMLFLCSEGSIIVALTIPFYGIIFLLHIEGEINLKKLLFLPVSIMLLLALAACGEEVSKKEVKTVESTNESAEKDTKKDDEKEPESSNYDEVLLDDDVAIVTLKSIETVADDIFGDEHKIKLEIENKSDKTIVVQSDQTSIDGFMVDDMVVFSETVAAGKKAKGSLDIMSFDDELPELNDNLEFILIVIDDETFDRISETDIKVDLK